MSLAADQHGALSGSQIRAAGATPSQLRTLVAQGVLVRAAPRTYVLAGSAATTERSLRVGLLSLGDTAVVSHEAAARLHGFDRYLHDAVEFTVPRRSRGVATPFRVHTSHTLGPLDRVMVAGFRCTSATRTIIDLARTDIRAVRLEAAIDSAVRAGTSASVVLARRLDELRGPGCRGSFRLAALLPDSGGHSPLERRFLRLLRDAALPRPRTQVIHRIGTRTLARVDFLFEAHGVVVEVSGRRGHSSDAERAIDAQRRNELQALGRAVYEYTTADLTDRPEYVVATLRRRLQAGSVASEDS